MHCGIIVYGSGAAYILGAGAGHDQIGFAYVPGNGVYGYYHGMHVHTYKRTAYIHTGGGFAAKILYHNVIVKAGDSLHGKRTSCVQLGLYPYLLKVELFHTLPLYHQAAVQMLAALYRKVQPLCLYLGQHGVHYRFRGFNGGAGAYALAHYLAGGAAYYQYIAPF